MANVYEEVLSEFSEDTGWTVRSERAVLLSFLEEQGISLEDFHEFVARTAANESSDPDCDPNFVSLDEINDEDLFDDEAL